MKFIKNKNKTEIWLTGSDVRRLERGESVSKGEFIVYMDFFAGEEIRVNQTNPEKFKDKHKAP